MRRRLYGIAQALAGEAAPALQGDTRAGLFVVGGGFTGLWTAILVQQAPPELDVAVAKADVCGGAASVPRFAPVGQRVTTSPFFYLDGQ